MTIRPIAAAIALAGFFAAPYSTPAQTATVRPPASNPPAKVAAVDTVAAKHNTDAPNVAVAQKPEPKMHQVQDGDTLSSIAQDNQTTYVRLYDANTAIEHPDMIHPGDELRIPEADEQLTSRELPQDPAVIQAAAASEATAAPAVRQTAAASPAVADGSVWDSLARCESGGNWSINTGNGFYGGLQFTLSTWQGLGGTGYPHEASRETQIAMAEQLLARSGWGNWPACTAQLGLR